MEYVQRDNGEVYIDLESETKNRENLEYGSKISVSKMISDIKNHYSKEGNRFSLSDNSEEIVQDTKGRKFTKQQKERYKGISPELLDENGNLKVLYHGSNSKFTIFDLEKGGESSSEASIGFWFTESEKGAKNFADEVWYGNERDENGHLVPKVYEVYLNLKNPKVYELVENEELKQQYKNEAKELEKQASEINEGYFWRETGDYKITSTFDDFKRMLRHNEPYVDPIALAKERGISEEKAKEMLNDAKKYFELSEQAKQKENEYNKLRYNDPYEQFKTDIYELAGMSAEDANFGGIGMAMNNKTEVLKQYREGLIAEGYDGIVIKGTRYDSSNFEGTNNQYVAFYPEQIKNVTNKKPTDNPDINMSLSDTNEDIAPIRNYYVNGKDVKADVAPDENIAPASQEVVDNVGIEHFKNLTDDDIAPTEGTFIINDGEVPEAKGKRNIINDIRDNFNIKTTEARELYNKIADMEEPTTEDIYNELEKYREIKWQEQDDYVKSIQNDIRGTRLDISNVKGQIADYGNSYRMSLMGKGLILGNSGQAIDDFYQELSNAYPNVFPASVTAEADQLNAIADFMYKDTTLEFKDTIDDASLMDLARGIKADIGNNERYNHSQRHAHFLRQAIRDEDILAPGAEPSIRTNITEEDYIKSLDNLTEDYAPYLEMRNEINASNANETAENVSLVDELNRLDENTVVEEKVAQNAQNKANK